MRARQSICGEHNLEPDMEYPEVWALSASPAPPPILVGRGWSQSGGTVVGFSISLIQENFNVSFKL